ncbi:MAG: site-specific integrase [Oscillospiraceae bacterium]|nr:site-specific integrase [Oscillospiraceae bacterium]
MGAKKVYETQIYVGTENGKVIHKHIRAGSQRELNAKVNTLKVQLQNGKNIYDKALFGIWADKWLNEIKIPSGIGNGTLTQYKSAIAHLNREFEFVEMKNITLSQFQSFINGLAKENPNTGKPMAKATLENIKKVASGVFGYARSNNIAGVPDFFKSVIISKYSPVNERRALTEDEQQWIIETEHRAQLPAMIMMFAGLRKGEVIPLEWADIDLKKGLISVNKSVEFVENKGDIKNGGKTVNAKGKVPIPPILVEYLSKIKKESKVLSKYVCVNASGNYHTKSSWRKMWDSYLNDLNVKYGYDGDISKFDPKYGMELPMRIPRITPHYLRHTFATLLFLEGVNVVSAKQYLGHADISTTVNIYTDLENFNKTELSENYVKKLENEYKIIA